MRPANTLFLVSALLFVCGVGLVVVAARTPRTTASPLDAPLAPVASVRQIMRGIVDPAATTIFGAVSTTVTTTGVEEQAPHTAEEWEAVANSAAALAEAGNLLRMANRAVDRGDWLTAACDSCHSKYERTQ